MFKTFIAITFSLLCNLAIALDLNSATSSELQSLKGIGAKTAELIVSARQAHAFDSWEDFQSRIKGIGPGKSAKLSEAGLTIGGQAFTPGAAKSNGKSKKAS